MIASIDSDDHFVSFVSNLRDYTVSHALSSKIYHPERYTKNIYSAWWSTPSVLVPVAEAMVSIRRTVDTSTNQKASKIPERSIFNSVSVQQPWRVWRKSYYQCRTCYYRSMSTFWMYMCTFFSLSLWQTWAGLNCSTTASRIAYTMSNPRNHPSSLVILDILSSNGTPFSTASPQILSSDVFTNDMDTRTQTSCTTS